MNVSQGGGNVTLLSGVRGLPAFHHGEILEERGAGVVQEEERIEEYYFDQSEFFFIGKMNGYLEVFEKEKRERGATLRLA